MNAFPILAAADRLTFAEPRLFALAGLIPALIILRVLGSRRKERGLRSLVAPGLRPKLVLGESPRRDAALFIAELLGLALVVTALARPQFGETQREALSEGRNLIVAIDTSRSMLATDLEPDRLTRAKLAASDLIQELPNDRIGIMAFAGNAVLQVPLTIDHAAIAETLDQLDIYSIEKGGSDLGAAIDLSIEHFGKISADKNALILFTDGEDLAGKGLDAAEKAAEKGILIITVGVGSTLGSIVPDAGSREDGQFIRNRTGELVKSRLDVDSLEKIAARTHGMFINLNARSMNAELVENMLNQLDTTRDERNARIVPIERYQWPLGAGTLLLTLAFVLPAFRRARRFLPGATPATASLALFGLLAFAPTSVRAGTAVDAWQAYSDAEYSEAVDLYNQAIEATRSAEKRARLEFGRGAAAYKGGDLDTALDAYSQSLLAGDESLREQSHYNLGNTLFRRGEKALQPGEGEEKPAAAPEKLDPVLSDWESAAQHYDDTLTLNPGNESARRNAQIVRQRIEELKKEQEKQEQQQKQDEQQKKDEEKKDEPKDQDKKEEQEEKKDEQEQDKQDGEEKKDEEGQPKEDEGEKEGDKEGEEKKEEGQGEEPKEDPEGKDGEKSDQQPGEEGEESEEEGAGEGDPTKPGEEQSTGEKEGQLSEDEQVNPETGYSKMDAERILRMLSDEQLDMTPLRRRVRIPNIDDW